MINTTGYMNAWGLFNRFYPMYITGDDEKLRLSKFLIVQNFINVFVTRFQYNNLPEETMNIVGDNNFIELMLYFAPSVAWFKDPVLGLQCLPTTGEYDFDIVGKPTRWRVHGLNGYERELSTDNSVLMFNDKAYSVPIVHILYEADFMVELDGTHRQQIRAQRKPIILEMEEDEVKSGQKFIQQLTEFKDYIVTRLRGHGKKEKRNLGITDNPYDTKVFDTQIEFNGKSFMDDYKEFENRVLTYLGINNVNIEKRERLLTGEISANDMLIQTNYTSALSARTEAIDKVNKMFGTKIEVVPRELTSLRSALTSQYELAGGNINVTEQSTVQRQNNFE